MGDETSRAKRPEGIPAKGWGNTVVEGRSDIKVEDAGNEVECVAFDDNAAPSALAAFSSMILARNGT